MHLTLGIQVDGVRLCWITKPAQIQSLPIERDVRIELSANRNDAKKPAAARRSRLPYVLGVDGPGHMPKVGYPVVTPDAVDVVNLLLWPFPVHPEPRKTVREVEAPLNCDTPVAAVADAAGDLPSLHFVRLDIDPSEDARLRVIAQDVPELLCGEMAIGHELLARLAVAVGRLPGLRPAARGIGAALSDAVPRFVLGPDQLPVLRAQLLSTDQPASGPHNFNAPMRRRRRIEVGPIGDLRLVDFELGGEISSVPARSFDVLG
jgi:hypothetical protein